jgi:cytochrome c biogenesis protein CcmG, thiol:disulfide interchange protein DsbE
MTQENSSAPERKGVPLWAQVVIWIGLLGLLLIVGLGLSRAQQPVVVIGSTIPDFTLTLFEGYEYKGQSQVTLSELRGKVVFVNVWASWCKPCEQEAPFLESAWRYYAPSDQVVFLGVDYVDTEFDARKSMEKFDITYPNGPDLGTRISQMLNRNMGVPETYVIDREGVLRQIKIGPFMSVREIQAIIDPLLTP